MNDKIKGIFTIVFLITIGIILRCLPHPPNFTPIGAIALFGGIYLSKKVAISMPILAMIISDFFIGPYDIELMLCVYGGFIFMVFLGSWLKKYKKYNAVLIGSLASAFLFFVITNFAVWIFTPWYSNNLSGLSLCYAMGLPFLKNDLIGTLFYTGILVGSYEFANLLIKKYSKFFCRQFIFKEKDAIT